MNNVIIRCTECGNAMLTPRADSDPPGTRVVVTNECDICDTGGWGECWYYDRHGDELEPT